MTVSDPAMVARYAACADSAYSRLSLEYIHAGSIPADTVPAPRHVAFPDARTRSERLVAPWRTPVEAPGSGYLIRAPAWLLLARLCWIVFTPA